MSNLIFDLTSGIYSESSEYYSKHLIDKEKEKSAAKAFEYQPKPPITIKNLVIEMEDEYNGYVSIKLSNGQTVEYKCDEIRGVHGPAYKTTVSVSQPNRPTYIIGGDDFLEKYAGSGSWVNDIMNCYKHYESL